ncbi:hypothetical protein ABEB36_003966 [Hypothenemus hampei]|uniref:Nose resistant-to-fluoxetine protein N-terminal domain-containing protein n=1 Tax=Hypothenemus hampei TaxID=57062 RepID=A0ABD1F1Q3_HYPHA
MSSITIKFLLLFAIFEKISSNYIYDVSSDANGIPPINYWSNLLLFMENSNITLKIQEVVSDKCAMEINWFFENLHNLTSDNFWALKMIDASAKIPAGILKLNLGGFMGNFDQCLEIRSDLHGIEGKYCLGTLYIDIEDVLNTFISRQTDPKLIRKLQLFQEKKFNFQNQFPVASYPSFGICIPSGCETSDLDKIVSIFNLTYPLPFECQTMDQANPPLSAKAICVIVFFIIIICLMVLSTTYDVYCRKNNKDPNYLILVAFSVYTNGKKLFNYQQSKSELSCLNGIRVLSMLWVIVGHCFSVTITGPVSNGLDVLEYIDTTKSMIFASAVHSVDSFLMVTGLLVVYTYKKSKHLGIRFNLFQFYLHRYLRLTPAYLAVILVSMALLQYMGSGPHWSFIVNYFQNFCEENWWSSLLYLQNYINVDQWCVGQTWYLNIDWQLYLCAPIFLYTLSWKPTIGKSLLGLALITFIVVPFYITWINRLPALITNLYGDIGNYQTKYYLRTHTRASPWFVGALYGYVIAEVKFGNSARYMKLNKLIIYVLWIVALTVIPLCIFLGHDTLRSETYHKYANAFYNALVRPTWALCIGWVAFACSTGYGGFVNTFLSLPIFQILNKFTYSIYLLHVTMLYMIIYASKTPAYYSFFNIAYSFWGITMLSFAVAVFWVLAFESPVILIERTLFSSKPEARNNEKINDERNV